MDLPMTVMNSADLAHVRAAAQVLSASSETWTTTEDELVKELATTPGHVEEIRFLVFDGPTPVAYARVGTYRYLVDPGRLLVTVRVIPSYRRRGIGTSLVETMKPWIQARVVEQMWASTDLDATGQPTCLAGDAFAAKYGMQRRESRFESIMDTSNIDLQEVAKAVQVCAQQGITITTIEALLTDPKWHERNWQRELYEVDCIALADEPTEQGGDPNPFDEWKKEFLEGQDQAGMVVAIHDGLIVGLSLHWVEDGMLLVASTGTLPAFRGMGVARAMKLTGAAHGCATGMSLRAFNQDENAPIVNLNRSLGFTRKSGQVYWKLLN
jgi:GNAT superfamily N-acetyltransferase